MGQVSVRCIETSLNISRLLILSVVVVPGGVYSVLNGLSQRIGNLAVCVWVIMVFKS